MMEVIIDKGELSQKEINEYVNRASKKHPGCKTLHISVVDDDFVDLTYEYEDVPWQRTRRITGYLVGTVDRWNDAKRAELEDRVKHGSI